MGCEGKSLSHIKYNILEDKWQKEDGFDRGEKVDSQEKKL